MGGAHEGIAGRGLREPAQKPSTSHIYLAVRGSAWVERVNVLLAEGGAKVAELDALIAGAEQFLWGPADLAAAGPPLAERLRAAKAWVSRVRCSFLQGLQLFGGCRLRSSGVSGRTPALVASSPNFRI